jgi:hypothetical protein
MEAESLLHTLENKVDAIPIAALHLFQMRPDVIFFAHPFLRPFHRDLVVPGEGFNPVFVFGGSPRQNLLGDRVESQDVAEEMHDVLLPCQ